MDALTTLYNEIRSLSLSDVIAPLLIFAVYWLVSRILRSRADRPWLTTLILLTDVLAYPALLIALQIGLATAEPRGSVPVLRNVLWALLVLLVAWLTVRLLRRFLWRRAFLRRYGSEAPRILQHLVALGLYLTALAIVIVVVFERSAGGVLVSTGVIVGVLGLALQNVLSDLFSGITIALEQPYGVGDWLTLPDGREGEVSDITWQATYLRSFNNGTLVLPNSYALRQVLHNHSRPERRHAAWLSVFVDRSYDPETVRRLILEAVLSCQAVLDEPTPIVNISDASGNPIRYLVYASFRDFPSHFAGINDAYMNIQTYLGRAGIGSSPARYEIATESVPERQLHMPSLREELSATEIFSVLSPDQIDVLAEHSSYHTYYPEQVIVQEGAPGNTLLILTSGVARVSRRDDSARDLEVARLGAGDIIGEMSLLTGERRSATVSAIVQVTVIEVGKDGLEPILQAQPALSDSFAQVMLERRLKNEQFLESMRRSNKSASDFVGDYLEAVVRRMRRFFRLTSSSGPGGPAGSA